MINSVVIGHGMVGKAVCKTFGIKKWFDKKGSNATLEQVSSTRYVFICLPTDERNGRYMTDDITSIVKQVVGYGRQNVFIIKSTVHPGFADNLMEVLNINSVVSSPEFLTEKTWKEDAVHPDLVVIGGKQKNYIDDVVGLYRARFKGLDIFTTDNVTAEMSKMAINAFYATKVVFANQIYDYCQRTKSNYEKLKEIMYKRKWIGKNHLEVFHQGGRGAAGKCLRKDLSVFAEMSNLPLFNQVNGINNSYLQQSGKK